MESAGEVHASSSCVSSAPFQRLPCSHTCRKEVQQDQLPTQHNVVHCRRVLLPFQEVLSPLGISSLRDLASWFLHFLTPGVQEEGEVGTDGQGEVEGLTLACQCLAKVHPLGDQVGVFFTHLTHFGFTSESVKLESCRKTCCHHFQFLLSSLSTSIRSNAAGTFCVVLVNPVPDINLGSTLWLAGSLLMMRECLGHP